MAEEDYSHLLVKQYKHWGVYMHQHQNYLGRLVVWCDREDALQLTDANEVEQKELFVIFNELKEASEKAFGGDWFNFSFLGNETHHLHGHFIPRYNKRVKFEGVVFEDKLWGKNYDRDRGSKTDPILVTKMQDKMKACLAEL